MTLLIVGLLLFFAIHFFPRLRTLRARVVNAFGEIGYKIAFAGISLAGLGAAVHGYATSGVTPVYEPLEGSRAIAHAVMPFAFLLAAGSQIPSNLKRFVRHPLAWGALIWAAAHLTANGDLASVILFGGFALYAMGHITVMALTGPSSAPLSYPRLNDLLVIIVGLISYGAVVWAHGAVFGVYVVG